MPLSHSGTLVNFSAYDSNRATPSASSPSSAYRDNDSEMDDEARNTDDIGETEKWQSQPESAGVVGGIFVKGKDHSSPTKFYPITPHSDSESIGSSSTSLNVAPEYSQTIIEKKQCPIPGYDVDAAMRRSPSPTPTIPEIEEITRPRDIHEALKAEGIRVRDYGFDPTNTGGPITLRRLR